MPHKIIFAKLMTRWVFLLALTTDWVAQAALLTDPVRQCVRNTLAKASPGDLSVAIKDGFAVMDPHTGHVLWIHNQDRMSQFACQPASLFKLVTAYALLALSYCKPQAE